MMKNIILLVLMLITPTLVSAKEEFTDLKETLRIKDIVLLNEDYQETSEQVTIYLFWTKDCEHCTDFLMFLNSISAEKGNLFKLRSYEVEENKDNLKLLKKVSSFFKEDVNSVPYIIIGESTFQGYSDDYNEKILEVLESEYQFKEKYDVFKEIDLKKENNKALNYTIITLVILVGTFGIYKLITSTKN